MPATLSSFSTIVGFSGLTGAPLTAFSSVPTPSASFLCPFLLEGGLQQGGRAQSAFDPASYWRSKWTSVMCKTRSSPASTEAPRPGTEAKATTRARRVVAARRSGGDATFLTPIVLPASELAPPPPGSIC